MSIAALILGTYLLVGLVRWGCDAPLLIASCRQRIMRHRMGCPICSEVEMGARIWHVAYALALAVALPVYAAAWPFVQAEGGG